MFCSLPKDIASNLLILMRSSNDLLQSAVAFIMLAGNINSSLYYLVTATKISLPPMRRT